jgi:hypothetical protein
MPNATEGEATELPDHNYGVIVENDMDARRLLWLVNKIGEKKLIASVGKYNKRFPGYKPFVSTLLKWYQLKVPVNIYAMVNIPIYRVYIMYHIDSSTIKIGFSGNWVSRVYNLTRYGSFDMFDLKRSVAFNFYGNKRQAMKVERMAKKISSLQTFLCRAVYLMGHMVTKNGFVPVSTKMFLDLSGILILRKSVIL